MRVRSLVVFQFTPQGADSVGELHGPVAPRLKRGVRRRGVRCAVEPCHFCWRGAVASRSAPVMIGGYVLSPPSTTGVCCELPDGGPMNQLTSESNYAAGSMKRVLQLHVFNSSALLILPAALLQVLQVLRASFAATEPILIVTVYSGSWSRVVVVVHLVAFPFTP